MKLPVALFAFFALTLASQAQTERTPPAPAEIAQHEVSHLTTLLSLTADQEAQATALFTAEATSSQSLRTSERTAHEALETAVKNEDIAAINSTAATLGQLNGQQIALRATAQAKFYAALTADQKTKYAELERRHHRGADGPGGPDRGLGGPPPPPAQ